MNRLVVDASVLAKPFSPSVERNVDQSTELLKRWEEGSISFVAPELLTLELMNVAARKWGLDEPALIVLGQAIDDLDIDMRPVPVDGLAHWAARGLSAYDAAYVAVAEAEGLQLATDDDQVVGVAGEIAVPLASFTV